LCFEHQGGDVPVAGGIEGWQINTKDPRKRSKEINMPKIESLHGTTPAEIFQSGLENINDIEAISLSVLWTDGSVTAGWSNVDMASLALMILTLDQKQRNDKF
jgi:hypothetical protein